MPEHKPKHPTDERGWRMALAAVTELEQLYVRAGALHAQINGLLDWQYDLTIAVGWVDTCRENREAIEGVMSDHGWK